MVVRDVRGGYQHRALSEHRELRERHGARAADDDIRRRHLLRHIEDVLDELQILMSLEPVVMEHLLRYLILDRPGGVDMQELRMIFPIVPHEVEHLEVDLLSSHTAAAGEEEVLVFPGDAELFPCRVVIERRELRLYRVADFENFRGYLAAESLRSGVEVHVDPVDERRKHPDGDARNGV